VKNKINHYYLSEQNQYFTEWVSGLLVDYTFFFISYISIQNILCMKQFNGFHYLMLLLLLTMY